MHDNFFKRRGTLQEGPFHANSIAGDAADREALAVPASANPDNRPFINLGPLVVTFFDAHMDTDVIS